MTETRSDYLGLVRGFVWKARMLGGPVFEWWTPTDVPRKKAIKELLEIAGQGYDRSCIDRAWKTKGKV